MTAQEMDTIIIGGEAHYLACEPLEQCWKRRGRERPRFVAPHSACWRGYSSTWELVDGRLYLRDISGTIAEPGQAGHAATLGELFPGEPAPVFADWFTGTLRVPGGELLESEHMGYESVWSRERQFDLVQGQVTAERVGDPPPSERELRRRRMEKLLLKHRTGAEQPDGER
jgi:hypothetical protein